MKKMLQTEQGAEDRLVRLMAIYSATGRFLALHMLRFPDHGQKIEKKGSLP